MQMLIIYNKSTIVDSVRSRVWPSDEKRQDLIVNNIHDEQFLKICLSSDFFCLSLVSNFLPSGAILQNVQ